MVFEHIEKLQREYTDKLVVVDATRPELARFRDATGVVRTINMNGRALVEFDQYANIAWYDIELDYLRVVDQPQPKPEKKAAAPKAAAKAPAVKPPAAKTPADKSAGAAKPGRLSVAEMLAAARATGAGSASSSGAAPTKPAAGVKPTVKPNPAAQPTTTPAAKPGKMSTADILAAARAKKAASETSDAAESEPAADETIEQPIAAVVKSAKAKAATSGPAPTTTAEKIAWCRDHDAA